MDEQMTKIVQAVMDAARKGQGMRFAPWQVACAGMTAGAALLAAGVAIGRWTAGVTL
jgi:hypothetical protein